MKPTNYEYESKKYGQKKKSSQETESEDKLPRVLPSKQEGLKHPLINVDEAPVLLFMSQFLKIKSGC